MTGTKPGSRTWNLAACVVILMWMQLISALALWNQFSVNRLSAAIDGSPSLERIKSIEARLTALESHHNEQAAPDAMVNDAPPNSRLAPAHGREK